MEVQAGDKRVVGGLLHIVEIKVLAQRAGGAGGSGRGVGPPSLNAWRWRGSLEENQSPLLDHIISD